MKLRWILAIILVFVFMVSIGCSSPQKQQPPTQPAPQQQSKAGMEDPGPIMSQMTQAVDQIMDGARANQWSQVKQAGATLVAQNDKLAPHFSDTAFRDSLHHEIGLLNDELNKTTPNQSTINAQVDKVRNLLKQAPTKVMTTH